MCPGVKTTRKWSQACCTSHVSTANLFRHIYVYRQVQLYGPRAWKGETSCPKAGKEVQWLLPRRFNARVSARRQGGYAERNNRAIGCKVIHWPTISGWLWVQYLDWDGLLRKLQVSSAFKFRSWIGIKILTLYSTTTLDCGIVTIGDRVLFGPGVSIFAATHETELQSRRDGVEYAREVTIGNDCWIGGNTIIMPGITIGNGCTVGAGSVVTRDIPPFSVAIGSPARVVKKVQPVPDLAQEIAIGA